jgi:hypothetical protein
MSKALHDITLAKWHSHELAPATAETETSITSHNTAPKSFSNFCPEVAYDTFKLFGSTLILVGDDPVDRQIGERLIEEDPAPAEKDWRWTWSHVEPLHYSDCPMYAQLHQEKPMSNTNITFNGPVSGHVNVAGHSIAAPVMLLSVAELISKIDASNVAPPDKEAAKSKLAEFLSHPVVAAIIGGLAGKIGG